ncbi:MAG: peptidase inhibitor family I36 protein [Pseudonocardiales bacterium]
MRKRAIASLAVLGAAIATTMVTSPAYADGYCPANRICMWEDANFTGDRWVDTEVGAPGWFYDIDWFNGDNEISSIDNATGRSIRVWANDNPSGNSICLPPHTRRDSLGSFNDDAESFVVVQSC